MIIGVYCCLPPGAWLFFTFNFCGLFGAWTTWGGVLCWCWWLSATMDTLMPLPLLLLLLLLFLECCCGWWCLGLVSCIKADLGRASRSNLDMDMDAVLPEEEVGVRAGEAPDEEADVKCLEGVMAGMRSVRRRLWPAWYMDWVIWEESPPIVSEWLSECG